MIVIIIRFWNNKQCISNCKVSELGILKTTTILSPGLSTNHSVY